MELPGGPDFSVKEQDDSVTLALAGRWTVDESASIESRADALARRQRAHAGQRHAPVRRPYVYG